MFMRTGWMTAVRKCVECRLPMVAVCGGGGGGVTHPFWSLPGVTSHHMGGGGGGRCAAKPE